MAEPDEAVAVCFVVKIDDESLGAFNSCKGLGCTLEVEEVKEGGNNSWAWQLPTRITYGNVQLSRPVTTASMKIAAWFAGMASGVKRRTATIEARTLDGTVVARWALMDVIPVRWSGPTLSPDTSEVATETLELAHHGFLSPGSGG